MRIILNNGKYVNKVASTALSLLLLDDLSGSTGAFSLRRLKSSYTGNAIQVRRSSDNTTQDIGFVNNELDTASLNSFCSGTNGFVTTWYNQSDVSNDLIQTTSSNQPKIYDSSTGVELENGKPTITFDGTTSHLKMSSNTYGDIDDLLTTLAVVKTTSSGTQMITSKGYVGEAEHMFYFTQNGGRFKYVIENQVIATTGSNVVNQQNLFSLYLSTGTNGVKQFNNGSLYYQDTTTQDLTGSVTTHPYSVGYNIEKNNWFLQGNIQELITFDNNLISDRTAIENNINTNYSIYGLLLDSLSGSTGAFSLRKLKSSYNGSAIQVRRSSDNTTQDIGFVNNQLDTTTLNSFCSGTNGFVTIWYNQSDTNNNAIQTTASNQPKIYDSTTGVELENGKPAILFNDSNDNFLEVVDTSYGNIQNCLSNFTVFKLNSTAFFPTVYSKGYVFNGAVCLSARITTNFLAVFFDGYEHRTSYNILNSHILSSNIFKLGTNGIKIYINSVLNHQMTTTEDLTGTNSYKFSIGRNNRDNNYYWSGTIQEILLFSSDQTSNKTTIETDINTNYSIY